MFKFSLESHFPVEILTLNINTRLLDLMLAPIVLLFVTLVHRVLVMRIRLGFIMSKTDRFGYYRGIYHRLSFLTNNELHRF